MFKRDSFCGPAGDGFISEWLSKVVSESLDWLELDLEEACHNHDIDWDNGPNTRDDILFSLRVYDLVKEQKGAEWAWVVSLVGFVLVRCTAVVYKILSKFQNVFKFTR